MEFELVKIQKDSGSLHFLYENAFGRIILKLLTRPWISKVCGWYLNRGVSRSLIKGFVKNNGINLDDYEKSEFPNFNEFFSRQIKKELRPYDLNPDHFVCPCDGLLSVYKITDGLVMPVKQGKYSVESLLQDHQLAKEFDGGTCLVYRLCVNHYHRYAFAETGEIIQHKKIKGKLHTVRPIALRNGSVFCENSREYDLIQTEKFGKIVQMEVGAMLVGKISNHQESGATERGKEKGCFLYGGSTIIVLLQKDALNLSDEYFAAAENDMEISVKMGQALL